MAESSKIRFSIDVGGTFTDIVVLDEGTGEFSIQKVATTPQNTLHGILDAVQKAKIDLAKVESLFIHGSTTAINTLIQRKGAKTAYLTTRGFRDIPEIARTNRTQPFNMKYHKPPQIVPRRLRFEVPERTNYLGEIITELDTEAVRRIARKLKELNVEAVAVCFLHSFKNPVNERKARGIILEEYPEAIVSISSDIVMEHREYERSMTTIIDAYTKPTFSGWLAELEKECAERGFKGQIVLLRSDGGAMTAERAKDSPVNTLFSGPAGGVIGGVFIARTQGHPNIVAVDMGGTSFDISVIKGAQARTYSEMTVHGYPVLVSNLDVVSIGAGGGSIAWVDDAGGLHVGPESAGAFPGPICYNRGGTRPTVTDALVCSGHIDPGYFLGGEMLIDADLAMAGIKDGICRPLSLTYEAGCAGILKVILGRMADSIREVLVSKGDDPRDFGLLCYGGGGPLFAAAMINQLGLASAIIPVVPANFSALGMLTTDLMYNLSQTQLTKRLADINIGDLAKQLGKLVNAGEGILEKEGVPAEKITTFRSVNMRYAGQEHTLTIALDHSIEGEAKDRILEEFSKAYRGTFGYTLPMPVEIMTLRVQSIGVLPKPSVKLVEMGSKSPRRAMKGERRVFCFVNDKYIDHAVYERSKLLGGNVVYGPALVEEPTTVTHVLDGFKCEVDKFGYLIITRR